MGIIDKMKYEKMKEHKTVGNTMRYLDKFGQEIEGAIEFDANTGYCVVYEHENVRDPDSPIILKEKYHPDCQVVVDGEANPSQERLKDIRDRVKKGRHL